MWVGRVAARNPLACRKVGTSRVTSRAIVVFTGDPKREALRKGLPAGLLTTLHCHLIDTIRRTSDTTLILASDVRGHFQLTSGSRHEEIAAADLGEKIDSAFRFAYALGCESVLVLAGDVAGVTPDVIENAFATLEQHPQRCVIGPSGDGGFYLLGLNRSGGMASAVDWNVIPWFTALSMESLASRLLALEGIVEFVRPIDDIDSYGDAVLVTSSLSPAFATLRRRLRSLLSCRPTRSVPGIASPSADLHHVPLLRGPPLR